LFNLQLQSFSLIFKTPLLNMHDPLVPLIALLVCSTTAWSPAGHPDSGQLAPCSDKVIALATGIHLNIQGQYAEYNGTEKIIGIEESNPVNHTAFLIAKGELLSDIQAGKNIRQFNQEIAPPGNPALPGLAKYQAAQQVEQGLVQGLVGSYSVDKSALNSLLSNITAGEYGLAQRF
jgi:hypothetical protein